MELIEINGKQWQKYVGDEGQDVYVAMFATDQDDLLGKYADEGSFDILIDKDADFYLPPECDMTQATSCDRECIGCIGEDRVAFKFRKNVFNQEEQNGAFEGLWDAAGESNNRGMAAGPRAEKSGGRDWVTPFHREILDYYMDGSPQSVTGEDPILEIIEKHKVAKYETRGEVWLRSKIEDEFGTYDGFFDVAMKRLADLEVLEAQAYAKKLNDTMISDTSYATPLWSGITGFYGRYPRIPYGRATAHVEHNRETFEKCYPFARKLDKTMAALLPERYAAQKACADKVDKKFLIGEDTTFTTVTVNTTTKDRNARMACHRDAGSLNEGFSNLTVISPEGKGWNGGYLVAPEVRAAIDVRPGDLLLIDNMRVIHGNMPIDAPDSGEDDLLRMSLVFYFREDMLQLGDWDYEALRRKFVDDRRMNKEHEFWRERWNGVSPGMWDSQEWYDYLLEHGGQEMAERNDPNALKQKASLEDFF
jgi:hypothetical protein